MHLVDVFVLLDSVHDNALSPLFVYVIMVNHMLSAAALNAPATLTHYIVDCSKFRR